MDQTINPNNVKMEFESDLDTKSNLNNTTAIKLNVNPISNYIDLGKY
jgi:hypothetical protein